MTPRTQLQLLDRIMAHRAAGRDHDNTDVAPSSLSIPTGDYTDRERYEAEVELLSRHPQIVGLSGLVPHRGSYASVEVGRVPVVVTRDDEGRVRAVANVCRHRGGVAASMPVSRLDLPSRRFTGRPPPGPILRRRRSDGTDRDAVP